MIISNSAIALFILISVASLIGCNVAGNENAVDNAQSLAWADSADAKKDAEKAIDNKDYRLYVVAGRGERAIGVAPELAEELKERCGTQYIEGSTDLIIDDQHMDALKKAYDYAEKYNQIITKHCSLL